jgi:hypothetical protein
VSSGYVGLTDPDWYAFLSTQPRVDEVNFWRPHGGNAFRALRLGEPFFFKLRAPDKAIVGFGFFERFESLPAWLAWDCFGSMNGAHDLRARSRTSTQALSSTPPTSCRMAGAASTEWTTVYCFGEISIGCMTGAMSP